MTRCWIASIRLSWLSFAMAVATAGYAGITDYFPAKVGTSWEYRKVEPTATGRLRDRSVECEAVKDSAGLKLVSLRTTAFIGDMSVVRTDVYDVSNSTGKLRLLSTNLLNGTRKYSPARLVAALPTADRTRTWKADVEDDDGNVTEVEEYCAAFAPACTAGTHVYEHVLVVTKKTYWTAGPWAELAEKQGVVSPGFSKKTSGRELGEVTDVDFYAKGIGLVATLKYYKDGTLLGPVSSYLLR